jgi:hypothetical protein
MPCGTRKEMETDEEIVIESLNYSKKKQYPNSHVCEWNFNVSTYISVHKYINCLFKCFCSLKGKVLVSIAPTFISQSSCVWIMYK